MIFFRIEPDSLEFIDNSRGAEESDEFGAEFRGRPCSTCRRSVDSLALDPRGWPRCRQLETGSPMTALEDARAHFEAGATATLARPRWRACAESPDDAALLRVAGRAGVETGPEDAAVDQLTRVTELEPDSG